MRIECTLDVKCGQAFSYPGADQVYIACIGTTNLAVTLTFTLDVNLPASRADRLFLIIFEAQ